MKYYLGIDLGGTNIASGVVDEDFNIIATAKVKTACPRPAEEIAEDMTKSALEAISNAGLSIKDLEWIGVGSPGNINRDTGVVEYSNNLQFYNAPIAELLKHYLNEHDVPIYMDNDANTAAYGEFLAGSAKGVNNAIVITLGTGVGCGVIIDGNIYSGHNFAGGEFGHTVIEVDGYECTCGRRGCFEAYASASGLIRMTRFAMKQVPDSIMHKLELEDGKVGARTAFKAMRMGDEAGRLVVEKYTKYLATGITNAINVFQPEVLCIGGGICNEGDPLILPLKQLAEKHVYNRDSANRTRIEVCSLGNNAGVIGAAMLGKCTNRNKN